MAKTLPKVLVIGESFHTYSGGGITMSNLFGSWSASKLAVADYPLNMEKMNSERTSSNYRLGSKELKMVYPFNLIAKRKDSLANFKPSASKKMMVTRRKINFDFVNILGVPLLHFFGVFHIINQVILSDELRSWVEEVKPDFIYTQLSDRNLISLVTLIKKEFEIPLVIHIMDDWPKTINRTGLFKKFWDHKIKKEFQLLITNAHKTIAISEKMALEYQLRYGGQWGYFHNPIDIGKWEGNMKEDYTLHNNIRVLYMGRIGNANSNSIPNFAKVIHTLNENSALKIEFDIYTPNFADVSHLENEHINVFPPINHEEIPKLLTSYDLLYLPLDFDSTSKLFSKFSIPTKLTEYMMSGVPILVNAPKDTALVNYCSKNEIAFICATNKQKILKATILNIVSNPEKYMKMGKKSSFYAQNFHNNIDIEKKFRNIFL